jgi:hypothetical protein
VLEVDAVDPDELVSPMCVGRWWPAIVLRLVSLPDPLEYSKVNALYSSI